MAYAIAVANRKGGVGKSTVAVMLAYGLAAWGRKRVLVVDLDSQCNTSLILQGGEGWLKSRKEGVNVGDFFLEHFDGNSPNPKEYLRHHVGDVLDESGRAPAISLLPGSLLLEDVQGELFVKQSRESRDPAVISDRVRGRMIMHLKRFASPFDVLILDCAPGLSFAALAALKLADQVIVPFRPDYVSQFAVDRIAMLIEEKRSLEAVSEIPFAQRRYVTLANCATSSGPDRILIEEMRVVHPMLDTMIPQRTEISNAFQWRPVRQPLEAKYGAGVGDVRRLCEEVSHRVAARQAA